MRTILDAMIARWFGGEMDWFLRSSSVFLLLLCPLHDDLISHYHIRRKVKVGLCGVLGNNLYGVLGGGVK